MRNIKFRAIPNKDFMINENQKNTLNSIAYYTKGEFYDDTFIYGYLADGYIIGKTIEAGEEYFVPSYWIPVEKETIGQYTGLKDKNGKEIYEGDIIQYTSEVMTKKAWNCEIERIGATFAVRTGEKSYMDGSYLNVLARDKKCEVIGNILQNPELLEGEE